MKKLLLSIAFVVFAAFIANAQKTKVVKDEKTTKQTSSVPQKVHNTFSKKKEHNGKKVTHVRTVETTKPAK